MSKKGKQQQQQKRSEPTKEALDKAKTELKLVDTDMFAFKISDNKEQSVKDFTKLCDDAIGKINGSWRQLSKAALQAFIHNIRFGDSGLIAKLYARLMNETPESRMTIALRTAAKECCAITLSLDKSQTGKDDTVKVYKGTRDKDEWAKLWNGPNGPELCVEQIKKLETCLDTTIKHSGDYGLGLFIPKKQNSGGKNSTVKSKFHATGKEAGDLFVELRDLGESFKDEQSSNKISLKIELLEAEMAALVTRLQQEIKKAKELLSGVAGTSGVIIDKSAANDDPNVEELKEAV